MSIESMSKHDLAMMEAEAQCPFSVGDVDLFAPGGQEYWFDAYRILHRDAPVLRIPGGGDTPDKDGFIITKYEDVARIVRDMETFPLRYNDESPGQEVERNIIRGEGFGESGSRWMRGRAFAPRWSSTGGTASSSRIPGSGP